MREPSESNGELIGGTLVLVDRTSTLRLGLLLDENTERNFSLNHFFGDRSFFGGVDMVVIDEKLCHTRTVTRLASKRGKFQVLSFFPRKTM